MDVCMYVLYSIVLCPNIQASVSILRRETRRRANASGLVGTKRHPVSKIKPHDDDDDEGVILLTLQVS